MHPRPAPKTAPAPAAAPAFPAQLPAELRPDPTLLRYYALQSLLAGPFFWIPLAPLYFRYHTLRYTLDDEGITMRWGILFRREISLTYARIQDIHLSSNVVERWLGLARIQVQTASGSAGAEMTVEGIPQFEALRDFLYSRMRGARDGLGKPPGDADTSESVDPLAALLREIAGEMRGLRRALTPPEAGPPRPDSPARPRSGDHA